MSVRIHHAALWTADLEADAHFLAEFFGAHIGELYRSARRPGFVSRFAHFPGGGAIELMAAPWIAQAVEGERVGWSHVAISLGDAARVDRLAEKARASGVLVSPPRRTGDGYYEAIVKTPGGAEIEITA
jgi:lactoylglutathione lyase